MIQPKVTGYRQLSQEHAALMNEAKELAEKVGQLVDKLGKLPFTPIGQDPFVVGTDPSIDHRWVAIGKTDIQKGFMALVRSIAQPTSF